MKQTAKYYITLVIKGMGMGAADVVPGVSGGTIAFITGIYEELVNSIKSFNIKSLRLLLSGRLSEFWKSINGTFLVSVILGIGISIFSLAKGLKYLLENHPIPVWAFFFGLIMASAIYIAIQIKNWDTKTIIAGIAGIIAALIVTFLSPAEANTSLWFVFISGAIAICAMILPGISGSFILVLLGMYEYILEAVGNLDLPVLLIFLIGAAIGIISFSNLLSWLIKKFHNVTIAVLAGFMAGSLNKVWPWKMLTNKNTDSGGHMISLIEKNVLPGTYEQIPGNDAWLEGAIIMAIVGFILIFAIQNLSKKGKTKK